MDWDPAPLRKLDDSVNSWRFTSASRLGCGFAVGNATHAEIDLIADRLSSLTYQHWGGRVKILGDLDADQVARGIGATSGLGVTHILFRRSTSGNH